MENTDTPLPPIAIQVTYVELVEPDATGRVTRGPRDQIRKLADEDMRDAFGVVEYFAGHAAQMLGRLQAQPEQKDLVTVEMEFGLGFNTELKVYVVGGKAEASLKIKLSWERADKE